MIKLYIVVGHHGITIYRLHILTLFIFSGKQFETKTPIREIGAMPVKNHRLFAKVCA